MRFGKKLALLILEDEREGRGVRPYISHKILKQYLAETVRQLKAVDEPVNLVESCVLQIRSVLHEDLRRIRNYLLSEIRSLTESVDVLIKEGKSLGISGTGSLRILIGAYKQVLTDSCTGLQTILSDSVVPFWMSLSASVASICDKYITVVGAFRTIATYLEINVAGFRKILKQINKQLPGFGLDHHDHNYIELASLTVPLQARIEAFRINLQSITSEFSATTTPLPIVEFGTETILALSGNGCGEREVKSRKSQEVDYRIISSTNIHI